MKVEKNKVVELIYELIVDGQIADKCTEERPLAYIHGTGKLLKKFEDSVEGLEPEGEFAFTLTPAEGYGEHNPNAVIKLSKEAFVIDGTYREDLVMVGNTIPLVGPDGGVIAGVITEVGLSDVTLDLNPPMAGKTLNFTGKVLTVRDATEKELTEGLYGEHAGGCHGGKCHKGEGEGCCHEGEGCGDGEGCCHDGDGEGCCHGEGEGCGK